MLVDNFGLDPNQFEYPFSKLKKKGKELSGLYRLHRFKLDVYYDHIRPLLRLQPIRSPVSK